MVWDVLCGGVGGIRMIVFSETDNAGLCCAGSGVFSCVDVRLMGSRLGLGLSGLGCPRGMDGCGWLCCVRLGC